MHLLIATVALVALLGLWYLKGRLRFNRSNGRAAETYRSYHHMLFATVLDRLFSVAIWALILFVLLFVMR